MTRAQPMSKAERAALADALRQMKAGGARHLDLVRVAGPKAWLAYDPIRVPTPSRGVRP